MKPDELPRPQNGDTLLADRLLALEQALIAIADPVLSLRLRTVHAVCRQRATQVLEAARAEGTAMTLLPELVTRGSATAMPLAAMDEAVHGGLLAIGASHDAVRSALVALTQAARDVIRIEAEESRQRIERMGGPQIALRMITRGMLGRRESGDDA